ncbi:MAG: superoxide dismutase [Opitutaceae bacterium]|nr:superoxide dismutase [Opitutaceae bacterium]
MNPHIQVSRRSALKVLGTGAAAIGLGSIPSHAATGRSAAGATTQPFTLPKLPYAYDALEPHIDARTMEIHHSKHHQAYITNANNALKDQAALQKMSAEEMLRDLNALPAGVRTALRNNVGGHVNHAFFWRTLAPNAGGSPRGALNDAITKSFGSFDKFKSEFTNAAMTRFGSGWAWLISKGGKLAVISTANQDSPLSDGGTPLLGLDVWEHAYYLKYQNRRAEYVTAFWNVVKWDEVAANLAGAK